MNKFRVVTSLILFVLLTPPLASAGSKKTVTGNVVDSGTFVVFTKGKKIASEKFDIVQTPDMNVLKSELRIEEPKAEQKAELQLSSGGNLIRYEWSENGKGQAIVEPKDEFLVEHVTLADASKKAEQPFILTSSTMILDDGFFSQRELLLWRYLATQCQPKQGEKGCQLGAQKYGVIVPRQQTSAQLTVEYKGGQKVNIKGTDMDLQRFELHGEGYDWTVWIDAGYKIQKIAIDADSTEVYRE
ncbi:MAG: hypothetical protein ACXVZV_16050 [Terriglobales bacterium]